jgi:ectoine hydroxylase-related dioxygenase (phytanoyl-CoA dioxygenase family)
MITVDCKNDPQWLDKALTSLEFAGVALVTGVLDEQFREDTRAAMYRAQAAIRDEIGDDRLTRAGELGVLRLMLRYDDHFFRLLEVPEMLSVVDATVSETAILHLQNGLLLPPIDDGVESSKLFQLTFHRDFPRVLNGYRMSVNTFFAIDEFTEENGATQFIPGSHQSEKPSDDYMRDAAISAVCPAGSMIVFDSTVWHAAGQNRSSADRLAINQQFTRSYVKQQIDYVRALGDSAVLQQQPRTQQLLGWYTRIVTSLDEYYRPSDERLYRAGQG